MPLACNLSLVHGHATPVADSKKILDMVSILSCHSPGVPWQARAEGEDAASPHQQCMQRWSILHEAGSTAHAGDQLKVSPPRA